MDCAICDFPNPGTSGDFCVECEAPLALKKVSSFLMVGYLLSFAEGGRQIPLFTAADSKLYFEGESEFPVTIFIPDFQALPGDTFEARIELKSPHPFMPGMRFSLVEAGRIFGEGTITQLD